MSTLIDLYNMQDRILDRMPRGLKSWKGRLAVGVEYNKMARAIEAYLDIPLSTEHDMPETLEQLKAWYAESEGLAGIFNDAVVEYGIPVTLIDEHLAA